MKNITLNRKELSKWAVYIGGAVLIGGALRYAFQEVMGTFTAALLIAGGALLLGSLAVNYRSVVAFSGRRSTRLGANTAVMAVAVLGIIGVANFVGYRHHKRIDVTTEQIYSLSNQTRKIVSGLTKDVKVMRFDQTDDPTLHDLMKEYRDLSGHITYELIDPQAKPDTAKQYKVTSQGQVVVASGDRTETPSGTDEESLTSAIIKVTSDSVKKIYFVEGHGEKQISDTSGRDGYGLVSKWLKDENYDTKTVNLVQSNQVPSDCDVLVLAGPKQSLFAEEAASIGKYLDGGGKAMLLIDPDTDPKLEDVLKQWGLALGKNTIVDVSGAGRIFRMGPAVPVGLSYGSHSITKGFDDYMTFFPLARSVDELSDAGSNASTTDLVKTSEQSWAATDIKGDEVKYDPSRGDKKGPITVAAASTRSIGGDKQARLVVVGDSDFASNSFAQGQRNGDLFMNSINWLAEEENLISIRPKSPTARRVEMTASQQNTLFWLTIVFMPAAVIGSGFYIWWKRR
jgi:ABC-type uncharacterized transport system involved in gliding motility auxiliary subunit